MLPLTTKRRILRAFPTYFRLVTASGGRYQYTVSKWWAFEDHDHDYPELVLDTQTQAVTRTADSPADDSFGRSRSADTPDASSVENYTGRAVQDDWTLTVACRGQEYGVSAHERAEIFAETLYEWILRRDHGLDEPGDGPNEIPVILDCYGGISNTSDMTDDTLVQTRTISLQIKYVSAYSDTQDVVEGVGGSVSSGDESEPFSVNF